ncbi:MAG: sigma-70 family RNA polymerase sigma factor [Cytophagales bacterium]|nr:sigma-70 family RNA polymerase sigma factor [Cytophagales bacterium]
MITVNNKITDAQLIKMYKAGNEVAFAELLARYKTKIYTTIYMIVKDKYIAEDLFQETFIKVINKLTSGTYNEEGKFSMWVSRIAHNLAIDHFRKKKRYPTILAEDGSNIFNTLDFTEDSIESKRVKEDTHAALKQLIQTLPESQREVLIMRHYADMSFKEIAEATGVSINTALGRMRYALINLRKKFKETEFAYDQNSYPK